MVGRNNEAKKKQQFHQNVGGERRWVRQTIIIISLIRQSSPSYTY